METEMLEALILWGDRANRDTSHLMDIVIAGTIDQLIGHGQVILRPARLEEIISRIGPRQRDKDGGWVVTLLPGDDEPETANTEQTSAEVASMAGRILAAGNPLENDQVLAVIAQALDKGNTAEALGDIIAVLSPYLDNMMSIAGSALTQRG